MHLTSFAFFVRSSWIWSHTPSPQPGLGLCALFQGTPQPGLDKFQQGPVLARGLTYAFQSWYGHLKSCLCIGKGRHNRWSHLYLGRASRLVHPRPKLGHQFTVLLGPA